MHNVSGAATRTKRLIFAGTRIVVLVYLGFGLVLFFNQKNMLYYPSGAVFGECPELSDTEAITLENGARGYFADTPDAKAIVIMYHGNAGSACGRAMYASFFRDKGYATFIAEYAGYGGDPRGVANSARILADTTAIAAFVDERGFSHIVLFGKSLGASIAAYHATLSPPDTIILVNPMVSTIKLAKELYPLYPVSLLLRERYDTLLWASEHSEIAVTLIHAGADTLIPPHHSEELYKKLPQPDKTLTIIESATHNTLPSFPAYWNALEGALLQ